ncbi:MAG: tRNA uridine-5-carboxymethylaminomethyl(34) synthesis GTPase MnmE [Lachnospiraceae bacterium]|nr:tRNA uridine-5-carboxymethylaminomethyl(34) synthesis GTPase MnmE [Lachnospiraceae bacterium]
MNKTIAAIATAPGNAGISIIRVSGDEAFSVCDRIFRSVRGVKLAESAGFRAYYGHIYDNDEMIDEVIALVYRNPKSYTGEDTVEISCHGGMVITKRILDIIIKNGATPASPGEFSMRAFINGKMDLSKAEAVMDMISAKNEYASRVSGLAIGGSISRSICDTRETLLNDISFIEAALDDPEHIDISEFSEDFSERIDKMIKDMENLKKRYATASVLSEGVKTVIVGRPNAGKSSLINALCGRDLAIVTDIAGTTRDVLSAQAVIEGITFLFTDTAGIRDTDNKVEKIGVTRSISEAESADLILFVIDSSDILTEDDYKIYSYIKNKKCILIYNKTDLAPAVSEEAISESFGDIPVVRTCIDKGEGVEELKDKLASMFYDMIENDQVIIVNARQMSEIEEALDALKSVKQSIEDGFSEDIWSIDLYAAYEALGRITGDTADDDVINNIFSKFCMGK